MTVRQEESTPIEDYFHDSGINNIFDKLSNKVDDFDVDTEELNAFCESLIQSLKGLKAHIKKVEATWSKQQAQSKIRDFVSGGMND